MALDCRQRERRTFLIRATFAAAVAAFCALSPALSVRGDETEAAKAQRLQAMSADEKEDLLRKKQRFDDLSKEEQSRLRELHVAILSDPHAKELETTVKRYNQWLGTLASPQRSALLSITDPQQRIERIKELMHQQEERRFTNYLDFDLPEADCKLIYKWLEDFVVKNGAAIRATLPGDLKRRLDEERDETARRQRLVMHWNWQYRSRPESVPVPAPQDFEQLLPSLSATTRKWIDDAPEADRQHRVGELVRAAILSRFNPPPSEEDLRKFYAEMPAEQRAELEVLEADQLKRELRRRYNVAKFRERGGGGPPGFGRGPQGPRGGPGGRGGPPPRDGFRPDDRGRGNDRRDGPDFGGKPPPP